MSIDITAQERARRPHLYNTPTVRDFPFEEGGPLAETRSVSTARPGRTWVPSAEWPPDRGVGWTPSMRQLYDQMHEAGDAKDWERFRELQDRLCKATAALPPPARRSMDDHDARPVLDTLAGYIARWDARVPSTRVDTVTGRRFVERIAFDRNAFDEWLRDNPPSATVVQRDHQGELVGHWEDLAADEFGLGGRCAIYDTPAGRAVFAAVERGELTAFSCKATWQPEGGVVLDDADGPYRRVLLAQLREAGPVDAPADDWAFIVQVGGEVRRDAARMLARYGDPEYRDTFATLAGGLRDDLAAMELGAFLDEFARVLGVANLAEWRAAEQALEAHCFAEVADRNADQVDDLLFEERMRPHRLQAIADEHEQRTGRIVTALKQARRRANSDYDWWRSRNYRDARDAADYHRSKADAERVEADLVEHLDGDRSALRRVLAKYEVPRLPDDFERIRSIGRW